MLWEQGVIEGIIAGELHGAKIGSEVMLINAIFLLITLVMVFLSLTLKDLINRWVNIIVGIGIIGFTLLGLASGYVVAAYAILLNLSMVVASALIIWYAWNSKNKA